MTDPYPGLRLSDADREEALARLGEHFALGRLDKDEYDERSDAVWSARTRGDLRPVFADLEPPVPLRPVRAVVRRRGRSRFPVAPIVVGLVVLTVLTHLPFVLLGLLAWFVLCHRGVQRSGSRRGWS